MATAQTTSRKKTVLTIKEKYLALKELEKEGTTKKSIAKKYGVPPNTLSYWVKNKSDILPSMNQASMELKDKSFLPENTITLIKQFTSGSLTLVKELCRLVVKSFEKKHWILQSNSTNLILKLQKAG